MALKTRAIDHTNVAIQSSLNFYEYIAALRGLPENLNAIESIRMKTTDGKTKFRIVSSFVNREALI